MGEITNLSEIMKKKHEEENKTVKLGDDKTVIVPEKETNTDFAFGDDDSVKTNQGTGFNFPNGVGSGLSREQLEELKRQAIQEDLSKKTSNGPKL